MELKEYQSRALDAFGRWRDALETARVKAATVAAALEAAGVDIPAEVGNYPRQAWQQLAAAGEVPYPQRGYVHRDAAAGYAIPHICFKVPTGGGKTLLAAAALERLNRPAGLVLWMVPSNAIYQQTKAALWNKEHPYRQMLERASGGKVKLLEKDDLFTAADLAHYLCVMLISLQAANRTSNKDFLRMFRDSGRYPTLFPDSDDALGDGRLLERYPDLERDGADGPVKHSLVNIFKTQRPVIVLDEAHKAYGQQEKGSEQFVAAINRLNPGLVIELSATPNARRSNLLVDISGRDLKKEEMIKLPVQVFPYRNTQWQYTLGEAHAYLELLEAEAKTFQHNSGRYIRPIAVVRVERTGKEQRSPDFIHAEDAREQLISLGVPAADIAVQSSEVKELDKVDLLSELCPVRWIITKAALMEGWDCPFAYLLVMLDNTRAQTAITQLVGRVMRQPQARQTGVESLDQCYVYCQDMDVGAAVQYVKDGLEREGMTGLDDEVRSGPAVSLKKVAVQRREKFRGVELFLPKVLHQQGDGDWEELDYQRHILPGIDWDAIHGGEWQTGADGAPGVSPASVDLEEESGPAAVYRKPQELQIDTGVKIAWYARRLSDVLTNPWQAARVAGEMIDRMKADGLDEAAIYRQRSALASHLRETAIEQIEGQAERVFTGKLAAGEIRFDLETGDRNYRLLDHYEMPVAETDIPLMRYGETVQLSLFEPVFDRDFNDLERRFAFYLDEQKALQWWHRIAARQQGEYYLRGWRRERIWPDFVAMAGSTYGQPSVLVFETKGGHLAGNDDTEYKRKVFALLEQTFNGGPLTPGGAMTIRDGPAKGVFRLVFDRAGFPEAAGPLSRVPAAAP